MFNIGLSPANLIESQQAMDSITSPLKNVANSTDKALTPDSSGNVANFTTNIRGFIQNMAGKKGIGICAVGLKSFFGLTARYNEVLNNGTPEEIKRLKSDVEIAGRRFRMLANVYSKNEVAAAILGEILQQLDQGQDQALVLSALLSLATDNAKELALDKLNASNMLGMYIYGISIGCDFRVLADIIASPVGITVDRLLKSNSITNRDGLSNINKVFEYLEVGPIYTIQNETNQYESKNYQTYLTRDALRNLAWKDGRTLDEKIKFLESLKQPVSTLNDSDKYLQGTIEYNRIIEKAQAYLEQVETIKTNGSIYEDFKKLNDGAEELRLQGQLLHVNQGLETSYASAMSYISSITGAISTREYSEFRKKKIESQKHGDIVPKFKSVSDFNFHMFISNKSYRDACIDLYNGTVNLEKLNDKTYKFALCQILNLKQESKPEHIMSAIQNKNIHKVFFNILDTLQVPHYMSYLESADQLHQMMMSSSVKYRTIYNLGNKAINILGVYSKFDKEKVFKRTEQFVDRLMRDRFLVRYPKIMIPSGQDYFIKSGDNRFKKVPSSGDTSIELGTREGNASFKLLMETKIIPDLLEEAKNPNSPIFDNDFIKSLAPTVYKNNPQYSETTGYVPNINMSPRSDNDVAAFERVKYAFNQLRTLGYGYELAGKSHDLIELFWIYNQIAFGGRPGENTLTSVFQDVQDYRLIKRYRQFISSLDKTGNFEQTVSANTLAREVALRAVPYTTTMRAFYYEDPVTGELSWWETYNENGNEYEEEKPRLISSQKGKAFLPTPIFYTKDTDLKNYFVNSLDSDIKDIYFESSDNSRSYTVHTEKGKIKEIVYIPRGSSTQEKFIIPDKYQKYFDKVPTKSLYTIDGFQSIYDKDKIRMLIDNIVREQNCNL